MFDHVGFPVSDFAKSRAFYEQVLAPLGFTVQMEITAEMTGGHRHCGFGPPGRPQFWIGDGAPLMGRTHVAFVAKDRTAIKAFYDAAIAAGGTDNGAPGLRPQYHEHYYGAFVLDPDGQNIEAVCHTPE